MGDNLQVLEILIFAVIAGVLVFRLRSVLGRRTGNERRRDLPLGPPRAPDQPAPQVAPIPMPTRPRVVGGSSLEPADSPLAPVQAADPGFDRDAFLNGARGAFGIVVQAFAAGDKAKLQPLLSPDVFKSFADAIETRARAGEKSETKVVAIKSADVSAARIEGDTALVTVTFVSDQFLVTRNAQGKVIEGDPDHPVTQTDIWTFARSIRARDPNWMLIATRSAEARG